MRNLSVLQYTAKEEALAAVGLGALAGLAGGLIFGLMMTMMGFLPMVGMLVGQESAATGFVVHMVISVLIGAGYGALFGNTARRFADGAAWGTLYGVIWWVLGALVIMPVALGMPVQLLTLEGITGAFPSLAGHMVYGVITGLVFVALARLTRSRQQ
jgi:uncharacterized membrane protein YagU involved in acid resistance